MLLDKFVIHSKGQHDNPLWPEFIKWLNVPKRGDGWWNGRDENSYYGISDKKGKKEVLIVSLLQLPKKRVVQ